MAMLATDAKCHTQGSTVDGVTSQWRAMRDKESKDDQKAQLEFTIEYETYSNSLWPVKCNGSNIKNHQGQIFFQEMCQCSPNLSWNPILSQLSDKEQKMSAERVGFWLLTCGW